ncbi:MAG: site-2 protease family protein [bacterium]|nr:site-2 protease family protein [bacterium]
MFQDLGGIQLLFVLIAMLIGMSVHEAMHAFTGHWLGDDTAAEEGRLTLNPLKHIDIFTTVLLPVAMIALGLPPIFAAKPVPFNPLRIRYEEFGAALVGIAGPLTNLALACVGGLIFRLDIITTNGWSDFVVIFTLVNVALFVFNMIPFPPLDGSRLLYAFAPEPLQRVMRTIEGFGLGAIFLLIFVFWQYIGPVVLELNEKILLFILGR